MGVLLLLMGRRGLPRYRQDANITSGRGLQNVAVVELYAIRGISVVSLDRPFIVAFFALFGSGSRRTMFCGQGDIRTFLCRLLYPALGRCWHAQIVEMFASHG